MVWVCLLTKLCTSKLDRESIFWASTFTASLVLPLMSPLSRKALETLELETPNALDTDDLVQQATIAASSTLLLHELPENGGHYLLDESVIQMLPLHAGTIPAMVLHAYAEDPTELTIELRLSHN